MTGGIHLGVVEESGVVNGTMVERLDNDLILVCDGGVADVDKSIGRTGQEDVW